MVGCGQHVAVPVPVQVLGDDWSRQQRDHLSRAENSVAQILEPNNLVPEVGRRQHVRVAVAIQIGGKHVPAHLDRVADHALVRRRFAEAFAVPLVGIVGLRAVVDFFRDAILVVVRVPAIANVAESVVVCILLARVEVRGAIVANVTDSVAIAEVFLVRVEVIRTVVAVVAHAVTVVIRLTRVRYLRAIVHRACVDREARVAETVAVRVCAGVASVADPVVFRVFLSRIRITGAIVASIAHTVPVADVLLLRIEITGAIVADVAHTVPEIPEPQDVPVEHGRQGIIDSIPVQIRGEDRTQTAGCRSDYSLRAEHAAAEILAPETSLPEDDSTSRSPSSSKSIA